MMSAKAYCAAIKHLGLTQEAAGELFGVSARTGQRWATQGPPMAVVMLLLSVGDNVIKLQKLRKEAIKLQR